LTLNLHKRLEFRIPISPNEGFFAQVRFFNFALRALGGSYSDARIRVSVGDHCDIEDVRRRNSWSEAFNVVWDRVPDDICANFGIWGTANHRLNVPADGADIVILSDADTALVGDIDPLIAQFPHDVPAVRGHMAHFPPPVSGTDGPPGDTERFWPWLFEQFNIGWQPPHLYRYSMDAKGRLPAAPAYFNLGFVALNTVALQIFDGQIHEVERRIRELTQSHMRCQIAVTVIAHRAEFDIECLPAAYNAANDLSHAEANSLTANDIRVLHYLRLDEIDRSTIFTAEHIDAFLAAPLRNPINKRLQAIGRLFSKSIK
jgi:hypothetical protein